MQHTFWYISLPSRQNSITKSNSLVGRQPGAQNLGGVNRGDIETLTTREWDYYMQGSRIFTGDEVTGVEICIWSSTGDLTRHKKQNLLSVTKKNKL